MCTGKVWRWPTIGSRWLRQDVFRSQTLAESNKSCTRRSFDLNTWRSIRPFLIKVGSVPPDSSPVWKLVSSHQLRMEELLIWCKSLCNSQISYFIINMQFTSMCCANTITRCFLNKKALFALPSYLEARHPLANLADAVHLAHAALELGQIFGSWQRCGFALCPSVDGDVAGSTEVKRIVLVVV